MVQCLEDSKWMVSYQALGLWSMKMAPGMKDNSNSIEKKVGEFGIKMKRL